MPDAKNRQPRRICHPPVENSGIADAETTKPGEPFRHPLQAMVRDLVGIFRQPLEMLHNSFSRWYGESFQVLLRGWEDYDGIFHSFFSSSRAWPLPASISSS